MSSWSSFSQPRQEPEQAGRGPTCQLLQPPPVVFLNPNDRFREVVLTNVTGATNSCWNLKLSYLSVARHSVTPRLVRQCPEATHAWPAVLSWNSPLPQPSASTLSKWKVISTSLTAWLPTLALLCCPNPYPPFFTHGHHGVEKYPFCRCSFVSLGS